MNSVSLPVFRASSLPWLALVCGLLPLLGGCRRANPEADGGGFPPAQADSRAVEFPAGNPQLGAVRVVEAAEASESDLRLTGRLAWAEDVTTRVFSPLAGRVERVVAEIGAHVQAGETLALLHSPEFDLARAEARRARSEFAQAERNLARQQALRAHGASAQKDLEAAQAEHDRTLAERERTEQRLRQLGAVDGADATLFRLAAPTAGVVVDRSLNPGQEVRSDLVLAGSPQLASPQFVITDPQRLWLWLDVPESQLGRVRTGQTVEVSSGAYPGRVFEGRIDLISASLNPQTRVAQARARIGNAEELLKSEMYVGVRVRELAAEGVVQVPAKSVLFQAGKYYAFVETGTRAFERREVSVLREARDAAFVRGLSPGARVAAQGSVLLNELLTDSAAPAGAH